MDDKLVEKVTKLPIRFKAPPEATENLLTVVPAYRGCSHRYYELEGHSYIVGKEGETECTCGKCGAKIDPMFVLRQLATQETRWHESFKRHQEEMKRLDERSRTKCQHCGQQTSISRN